MAKAHWRSASIQTMGVTFFFSKLHVAPGGSRPTHGKARRATVGQSDHFLQLRE